MAKCPNTRELQACAQSLNTKAKTVPRVENHARNCTDCKEAVNRELENIGSKIRLK